MSSSSRIGVLFDVDGTLVDTNHLHALAWHRAFREQDVVVPMHRLHGLIGMASGRFVEEVLGRPDTTADESYSRHFGVLKGDITAFARAGDLLRELASRDVAVVLATSAKPEDVERLQETIGADGAITEVVCSGDVEDGKPDGEIFELAMERAGLAPDATVVVGDTVYDVLAARAAGVPCIGVRSGGICRADLEGAGAAAVYDDVEDLLAHLDESPIGALLRSRAGG